MLIQEVLKMVHTKTILRWYNFMNETTKYIVRIEKQEISYIDLEVEIEGDEEQAQAYGLEYVENEPNLKWEIINSTIYCPNMNSASPCNCQEDEI